MKKQILALINQKPSNKKVFLSTGVVFAIANTAITLPVNAQAESFLPPEVIPVSQAFNYGSKYNSVNNTSNLSQLQSPGLTAQNTPQNISTLGTQQTPQEARQALYHSLMGSNTYPQFNGQTFNQVSNTPGNIAGNMTTPSFGPSQSYNEGNAQTLSNQLNNQMQPMANMQMPQNMSNVAPPQTQVLSGTVATQNTSQQRTTGGISHLLGVVTGFGLSGAALAGMRSPGGAYSAGLLGTGMMNYGVRNGFRF